MSIVVESQFIVQANLAPELIVQQINEYINLKKTNIKVRLEFPVFGLPWDKIDSLEVDLLTNEDRRIYQRLVQDGKLKHFKGCVEGADLMDVEYKSN